RKSTVRWHVERCTNMSLERHCESRYRTTVQELKSLSAVRSMLLRQPHVRVARRSSNCRVIAAFATYSLPRQWVTRGTLRLKQRISNFPFTTARKLISLHWFGSKRCWRWQSGHCAAKIAEGYALNAARI